MSSAREAILAACRASAFEAALPPPARFGREASTPNWDVFVASFTALGGEVKSAEDLAALSEWRIAIDPDVPAPFRRGLLEASADEVWEADAGLTMADWAVAETGTVVLNSGFSRSRLFSLAPPLHVVLLPRERVLFGLDEVFARELGRTTVLITGPSRTADIEGVLVRGIHGPKQIWVVPI